MMKFPALRYPATLLAFILFTMSACALLESRAEKEKIPSCHASSENSSERKSDSSVKFCCEAGLIPNPNKSPIFKEEPNLVLLKFQPFEELCLLAFSSADVHVGAIASGPPGVSLNLPLRI